MTRAAERLGMQQPPLSQQIRAMERELDVQLFHRKARGVELTHAGHALLAEARLMLANLDRALETTRRAARGEQGRLCVGIAPTALFHPLIPRAIRSFRDAFPLVALTLWEGLSHEVVKQFTDQQMDVAFVRVRALRVDGLLTRPLLEEPMVVALPSHHTLARAASRKEIHFDHLAGETFILMGPAGTGIHDETIATCRLAGFTPRIGQIAPRFTSALGLVAAGLGVTLVPESMQNMRMEGVVYRYLSGAKPRSYLSLASRRGDASPVVRQFLKSVAEVVRNSGIN